jgi:hypothetical protein
MAHQVEDELPIDGLRLMRAFFRLRKREHRLALVNLAEKMAEVQPQVADLSIVIPEEFEDERRLIVRYL